MLDILHAFSIISGLRVRLKKKHTHLIWISSLNYSMRSIKKIGWKLIWGSSSFRLFGMNFHVHLEKK
jgi:hypothetical protein